MRPDKTIILYRAGNRMVVHPTTSIVKEALETELSYVSVRKLYGLEKILASKAAGRTVSEERTAYNCFTLDHRNRIATSFGFYDRVCRVLKHRGYDVMVSDLTVRRDPELFQPDWGRVFAPDSGIELRYGQDEFLAKAAASIAAGLPCRFDAVPGFGKGFLMSCLAMMYPRLRIDICTKRVPVLKDRLYPELCQYLPDVGICCGVMKKMGHRVQLFSFDSLHHSPGDADLLMVDECFPSGTLIDGRPVETIKVGDEIMSRSAQGVLEKKPVISKFKDLAFARLLAHVNLEDGSSLVCTANHPVWSNRSGAFVRADELKQGDTVSRFVLNSLQTVSIISVDLSASTRKTCPDGYVYNLEVEDNHTYFANGILVHNCHEAATDDAASQLAKYDKSINLGFSATHDMRLDNKDMRVEAMFGPVVYEIPYPEAVSHGLVVPIEVVWSDVLMDENPVAGIEDAVERKRRGVWRNRVRNEIIAADARAEAADGTQVLITCETIEHVLALKQLLPDFEVVYAAGGVDDDDEAYFRNQGLWPAGLPPMTQEKRDKLTRMFEMGHVRKAICNTVWNVGLSFNQLGVLVRADAGASPTLDTQIPGRTSRTDALTGKLKGRVRDYLDQFDRGFRRRAAGRRNRYAGHGWDQVDAAGRPLVDNEPAQRLLFKRGYDNEHEVAPPPRRQWRKKP